MRFFLHGFGQRYDLSGPLFLYLFAAAGVVVLSFVMVVLFGGDKVGQDAVAYTRWRCAWLDRLANASWPSFVGGVIGTLGLLAVIATGFFGSQQSFYNPAEYIVWVYFWAATVILAGLLGNLWTLLNPFAALYSALGRIGLICRRPAETYPRWRWGIWPAVFAYFAFACLELTSGVASKPAILAALAVLYTLITLLGMTTFGARTWLQNAEAFTALFEIISRFGPVETENDPKGRTKVWLRVWGTGLLKDVRPGWDRVLFIILMLSSLAFDGILFTPVFVWYQLNIGALFVPLGGLQIPALRTLGLILLTGAFMAAFVLIMRFVMWLGWPQVGSPLSRWKGVDVAQAMSAFALTLVPIALVYNAAHNYTYVVVQSQSIIPLLADPFQRGWRLLPTAGYKINFLLAGAAVVWFVQIILIVLGHVIAVYLSHLRAGERFKTASDVLLSQYPMLLLMVLYTMTSLWILAQPVTRAG